MSSGSNTALIAVPITSRALEAGPVLLVACEDRGVRGDDAVAAAGPHHRDLVDGFLVALAVFEQHPPKSLVGEDAGEVVDPTVSLGFPNDSNDFVGLEQPASDAFFKAGGI